MIRNLMTAAAFVAVLLPVNAVLAVGGQSSVSRGAPSDGRLGDEVRPVRYALNLHVDPTEEHFSGVAEIEIELANRTSTIWLHGTDLAL